MPHRIVTVAVDLGHDCTGEALRTAQRGLGIRACRPRRDMMVSQIAVKEPTRGFDQEGGALDVGATCCTADIAARRAGIIALEPMVRPLLAKLTDWPLPTVQELTIYDWVCPVTPEIGGYWSVATEWLDLLGNTVWSYVVAVAFDSDDRPGHFVITGARTVTTADTSRAALEQGIAEAHRFGPLVTYTPLLFHTIGI